MFVKTNILLIIFIFLTIINCTKENPTDPKPIDDKITTALPWDRKWLREIIEEPIEPYQDLRYADLRQINLIESGSEILKTVTFSTFTIWPEKAKIPDGFDPVFVMEWGKIPGLGINIIHEMGFKGEGINIAMIEQKLLRNHREYKGRIVNYRDFTTITSRAQMLGAASASLLVGKSCGILPQANLYYYVVGGGRYFNYDDYCKSLEDIIQLNSTTLANNPIRVVAVSANFRPIYWNLEDWKNTLKRAEEANILVFHQSFDWLKDRYPLIGARCKPYEDKNNPDNYDIYHTTNDSIILSASKYLLIPSENRTTADFVLDGHYDFWSVYGQYKLIPYISGVAAIGRHIKPNLSNDEIVELLYNTGTPFIDGRLINPLAFIDEINK